MALPFDEYFRKVWYPHLQWFQRSTDNCGKIHVRIILGHPIGTLPLLMLTSSLDGAPLDEEGQKCTRRITCKLMIAQ